MVGGGPHWTTAQQCRQVKKIGWGFNATLWAGFNQLRLVSQPNLFNFSQGQEFTTIGGHFYSGRKKTQVLGIKMWRFELFLQVLWAWLVCHVWLWLVQVGTNSEELWSVLSGINKSEFMVRTHFSLPSPWSAVKSILGRPLEFAPAEHLVCPRLQWVCAINAIAQLSKCSQTRTCEPRPSHSSLAPSLFLERMVPNFISLIFNIKQSLL